MSETIDQHVLEQYDIAQKVGQGAYGIVWKATHRKSGQTIALKKCFDAFRNNTDSMRTFREVAYLKAMSGHENIVNIRGVLPACGDRDLYITFEYMQTDLSHVIKAKLLTEIHVKFIAYQLLRALKYIHSAELLHRDIKPSNILIDDNCYIKLCDFGLCRSIDETFGNLELTDYVMTRWYRAPEVLFGSKKYTKGVDLWSVGCIIGEMIRGRPLIAGACTMSQIQKVLEVTGNPTDEVVASWQSPFAQKMLVNAKAKRRLRLNELCPNLPRDAKRIMKRLFRLDPDERIAADAALEHEYLAEFHNPDTEPSYPHGPIDIGINDNTKLSAEEYRMQLYRMIHQGGIDERMTHDASEVIKPRKVTMDGT
ncbi:mitogen-activated protein kinase [Skeletonema marinoi]|uniref:Mitogen-activated protein kinase n=1 Tax=Skeletonema marinoi TaxID=267567 RepID=A0AAD8XYM1_9STRA|nr:mitogen-activated protein kinase [Skeletonema marinoi]